MDETDPPADASRPPWNAGLTQVEPESLPASSGSAASDQVPAHDQGEGSKTGRQRPGRKRTTKDSFTGRSGQLAVMAELLLRGCNVAIPEVDLGTDVFAFRDDRDEVARIQVKTCLQPTVYQDGSGYSARFGIPMKQLRQSEDRPALFYVLASRVNGKWANFLVISRAQLWERWNSHEIGTENPSSGDLVMTVQLREDDVRCSGIDLTEYRDARDSLPPLQAPILPDEGPEAGAASAGVAQVAGRQAEAENLPVGERVRGDAAMTGQTPSPHPGEADHPPS